MSKLNMKDVMTKIGGLPQVTVGSQTEPKILVTYLSQQRRTALVTSATGNVPVVEDV